jgi:hypothetical protein
MKIRASFVSNSSSSSFIVGFNSDTIDKEFWKTFRNLHEQLFPKKEETFVVDEREDYASKKGGIIQLVVGDVVQWICDIFDNDKFEILKSDSEVIEEITGGTYPGSESLIFNPTKLDDIMRELDEAYHKKYNEWCYWDTKTENIKDKKQLAHFKKWQVAQKKAHDFFEREFNKKAKMLWKKMKPSFKGKTIFLFTFTDNGGKFKEDLMEHGNIFRNVPHIVISNH